jgi:cathepsin H
MKTAAGVTVVVLCSALFAHAIPLDDSHANNIELFNAFAAKYGKSYATEEERVQRMQIFVENTEMINRHNAQPEQTYSLAVNKFADMTWDEFKNQYLGANGQECSATLGNYRMRNMAVPAERDWRKENIVSEVKNQGSCGSCWTFSTTGCLESVHAQKTGKMVLFSEQQLIDCAGAFDNHGCNGGLPSHAFEYIAFNGGIDSESSYGAPYEAKDGRCRFQKAGVEGFVKHSVNITEGAENELHEAVGALHPVSVAFEVVGDFRFYAGGVYTSKKCKSGPMDVNHAVLAVGYGAESNMDYWIIKNSWGADWGVDGFFNMERGVNMCGVATCASYPEI